MPIEETNKDLSNTEHMLLDRYFLNGNFSLCFGIRRNISISCKCLHKIMRIDKYKYNIMINNKFSDFVA